MKATHFSSSISHNSQTKALSLSLIWSGYHNIFSFKNMMKKLSTFSNFALTIYLGVLRRTI